MDTIADAQFQASVDRAFARWTAARRVKVGDAVMFHRAGRSDWPGKVVRLFEAPVTGKRRAVVEYRRANGTKGVVRLDAHRLAYEI